MSEMSAPLVYGHVVQEGQAESRDSAIAAATAACRNVMEQYRDIDAGATIDLGVTSTSHGQ
jgi:hypothetical protein